MTSPKAVSDSPQIWLGLTIGNSRSHWALVEHNALRQTWTIPHAPDRDPAHPQTWSEWMAASPAFEQYAQALYLPAPEVYPDLWIVSVVPQSTQQWQTYPGVRLISLADIPLLGVYPTLGVDRALALWGASVMYGSPVFVIDCGTALTVTGANAAGQLVGGAILPGLGLQLRMLAQDTAALPQISIPADMPERWATDTISAIQSGVLHTLVAGIQDFITAWLDQYPTSQIVFTGGDGPMLAAGVTSSLAQYLGAHQAHQVQQHPELLLESLIHLRTLDIAKKRVS